MTRLNRSSNRRCRIVVRPTVQLGLDLQYPLPGPQRAWQWFTRIHQRPPGIPALRLRTCWLPSPCDRLSRPPTTTEPPPRPVPSADDVPALPPRWLHGMRATPDGSHVHLNRSTSEASSSTPAASPRLRRRSSPWPPGRLSHRDQKFPVPAQRGRVRTAASPYPPDLSWWAVKGRQTLISRVHLLVSLTGPASSGSADTSRRCQGCSHPHQHLLDRAAPSFTQPLRRPGDEGLSPPSDFRRLVAHVLFSPVIADKKATSYLLARVICQQPAGESNALMDQCSHQLIGGHDTPSAVQLPTTGRRAVSPQDSRAVQGKEVLTHRRLPGTESARSG